MTETDPKKNTISDNEANNKLLTSLELGQQDENYPFLSWLSKETGKKILTTHILKNIPFAVEVGSGQIATQVWQINPNVNWFFYEPGYDEYDFSKNNFFHLTPVEVPAMKGKAYSIRDRVPEEAIKNAKIIIFRNPNPGYMANIIPHQKALNPNQRLVIIINGSYISEISRHRKYLENLGYKPPEDFVLTQEEYSDPEQWDTKGKPTYVFDYTKPAE